MHQDWRWRRFPFWVFCRMQITSSVYKALYMACPEQFCVAQAVMSALFFLTIELSARPSTLIDCCSVASMHWREFHSAAYPSHQSLGLAPDFSFWTIRCRLQMYILLCICCAGVRFLALRALWVFGHLYQHVHLLEYALFLAERLCSSTAARCRPFGFENWLIPVLIWGDA